MLKVELISIKRREIVNCFISFCPRCERSGGNKEERKWCNFRQPLPFFKTAIKCRRADQKQVNIESFSIRNRTVSLCVSQLNSLDSDFMSLLHSTENSGFSAVSVQFQCSFSAVLVQF